MLYYPTHINIETSDTCNRRCPWCRVQRDRTAGTPQGVYHRGCRVPLLIPGVDSPLQVPLAALGLVLQPFALLFAMRRHTAEITVLPCASSSRTGGVGEPSSAKSAALPAVSTHTTARRAAASGTRITVGNSSV